MKKSLFVWLAAWYSTIAKRLEVTVNGKDEENPLRYLHKEMTTPDLSVDLKWGSSSIDNSIVAADVVAMDSELPLKNRNALSTASGDVPKVGVKFKLTEKQLSEIDTLKAKGVSIINIVAKVFQDFKNAVFGIYERNEIMWLQALSTGYTLIQDEDNAGIGIRVKFGIKDSHRSRASKSWSNPDSRIVDDIKRILKTAQGKSIRLTTVMMDDVTSEYVAENKQIKSNFAFSGGIVTNASEVPNLDQDQLIAFFKKKFRLTLVIVDRNVLTEKNGIRTEQSPWEEGMVSFLPNFKAGRTVYGILAEDTRRDPSVMYEKVEYILVKKWHTNEPFSEFTSAQALVIPVLDNAGKIFLLDTNEANADDEQTEGDDKFDYNGDTYTLVAVKAALMKVDGRFKLDNLTDEQLLAKINTLNEEQLSIFEENLGEPIVGG